MKKQDISFFEKNLTIWVLFCMAIGVSIGKFIMRKSAVEHEV